MRTPIMAVILTLVLAAPARADLITLQFSGVINAVSPSVATYVAPGLSAGDPFLITVGFSEIPGESSAVFSFGSVVTGQAGLFGSGIGSGAYPVQSLQQTTLRMMSGVTTAPPTTWPTTPPIYSPGGAYQTLFNVELAEGWQSGSMFVWLENAFIGSEVTGTVTGMTRVPEPATALLLALGVVSLARLRTRRSRPNGSER